MPWQGTLSVVTTSDRSKIGAFFVPLQTRDYPIDISINPSGNQGKAVKNSFNVYEFSVPEPLPPAIEYIVYRVAGSNPDETFNVQWKFTCRGWTIGP